MTSAAANDLCYWNHQGYIFSELNSSSTVLAAKTGAWKCQISGPPPILSLYRVAHFLLAVEIFPQFISATWGFNWALGPKLCLLCFGGFMWVWMRRKGEVRGLGPLSRGGVGWVGGQGLTLLWCSWDVLPWEWEEPRAPTLLKPPLARGHSESPGSARGSGQTFFFFPFCAPPRQKRC